MRSDISLIRFCRPMSARCGACVCRRQIDWAECRSFFFGLCRAVYRFGCAPYICRFRLLTGGTTPFQFMAYHRDGSLDRRLFPHLFLVLSPSLLSALHRLVPYKPLQLVFSKLEKFQNATLSLRDHPGVLLFAMVNSVFFLLFLPY